MFEKLNFHGEGSSWTSQQTNEEFEAIKKTSNITKPFQEAVSRPFDGSHFLV